MKSSKLSDGKDWRPLPKQVAALERTEFEVGFGGSRGGGKTDCALAWLLYDVGNPRLQSLIIRRNANDLADWTARARRFYGPRGAVFAGNPPSITWPTGAVFRTGHLKDENAYGKYQGHEYARILIEEAEQIPSEESYIKLISSCRSTDPKLRPQVFLTFNPGGPGHFWLKRRFRLQGRPKEVSSFVDPETGRSRCFVPSTIDDNPYLKNADPGYVKFLEGLPDGLREQWRWGDWDDPEIKGSIFGDDVKQAEREGRILDLPKDVGRSVETAWDLGVADLTFIIVFRRDGEWFEILDCVQGEGRGFVDYVRELRDRGWVSTRNHFPHDIAVREYISGKSRKEAAEDLLGNVEVLKRVADEDRIMAAKMVLPRCRFDRERCAPLLQALRSWRRKYDEGKMAYGEPLHDWSSHGADCFTYMALTDTEMEAVPKRRQSRELFAEYAEYEDGALTEMPFRYS